MSDIDLGLGAMFQRDGASAASNSVDPARVTATVEEHDFRAAAMPREPRPLPPPPMWAAPLQGVPLFTDSRTAPQMPSYDQRERDLRQYADALAEHEAARGFAWGTAVSRERYDTQIRQAELDRDLAHQRAAYAQAHPPTISGALGQAVVPWVPSLLQDSLVRLIIMGGLVYCVWALGQRLLPREMREAA
jgi:hypothetical protein